MLRLSTGGDGVVYGAKPLNWLKRSSPIAKEVNATGIVGMIGLPLASWRLPDSTPLRAGVLPSLKMTTPEAPAAWALSTFRPKTHVPRWMRAIRPGTNPVKSLALQPLDEPPGDGITMPPAG